tara:strand:- start:224 stop:613 length:390 start_codon:yes stop_codon:yes gene_type:complete
MFKVILKGKFKERRIDLSIVSKVMYHQPFTGSIQSEHIKWWRNYLIKFIYLEILYPKKGWITLVKIMRDGKPSIRVVTNPSTSGRRELLVLKQLYGKENEHVQKNEQRRKKFRHSKKVSKEFNSTPNMV